MITIDRNPQGKTARSASPKGRALSSACWRRASTGVHGSWGTTIRSPISHLAWLERGLTRPAVGHGLPCHFYSGPSRMILRIGHRFAESDANAFGCQPAIALRESSGSISPLPSRPCDVGFGCERLAPVTPVRHLRLLLGIDAELRAGGERIRVGEAAISHHGAQSGKPRIGEEKSGQS
jgi:hypothetical protein